jgi:hypothetical protein
MDIRGKITNIKNINNKTRVAIDLEDDYMELITRYSNGVSADVEIRVDDGRCLTIQQRGKVFAILKDIALYTGDAPEYLRGILTFNYCIEANIPLFSLSDCSITTARGFISFLIDFVLMHNIPMTDLGINRTDDIDKYLYSCLKFRRCCITGLAGADIHHVTGSRVGMGHDRLKIDHSNLEIIALSREWHNKVHNEGETDVFEAYKIYGLKGDSILLDKLGLNYNDIS